MIKICASSILKPLAFLCRNYFECFHKEWKKANMITVPKKMIKVSEALKKLYLTRFGNT